MPAPKDRPGFQSWGFGAKAILKSSTRHILTAARRNRALTPAHRDALAAALLEVRRAGGRIGVRLMSHPKRWITWAWD